MDKTQKENMPPNIYLIESKLVFKKKRDGRFRTCLVARGYTQIPGLDFTKNYSTVFTDVTLRIILIMCLIDKWDYQTIDIETEFSYTVLEE